MVVDAGLRRVLILWGIATLFAALVRFLFPDAHYPLFRVILEAALLGGAIFALYQVRALRELYQGATRPLRFVCALLFCAFLAGHLAKYSRLTFPFVAWNMYDFEQTERIFFEYHVREDSGEVRLLEPSRLMPPAGSFRLASTLYGYALHATMPEGDLPQGVSSEVARGRLRTSLEALATTHQQRYGSRVEEIIVGRCEVTLDQVNVFACVEAFRWPR